jgi:hypothetical protein
MSGLYQVHIGRYLQRYPGMSSMLCSCQVACGDHMMGRRNILSPKQLQSSREGAVWSVPSTDHLGRRRRVRSADMSPPQSLSGACRAAPRSYLEATSGSGGVLYVACI